MDRTRIFTATAFASVALAAYLSIRRRDRRRQQQQRLTEPERSWPERGVAARPSLLAGAGNGLFALRDFAQGEEVADYFGEVLNLMQSIKRENRDYVMGGFGLNAYVDASAAVDCSGRYINDNFNKERINARFDRDRRARRARVVALRRIAAGEEIYASYGEDYWRPRGINPVTGEPEEPDEETRLGLQMLERAKARARQKEEEEEQAAAQGRAN